LFNTAGDQDVNAWPLLWVAIAAAVMMLGGWAWQRRTDNAGVVDVLWSAGMAASAVYYAAVLPGAALPRLLVGVMGGLWGARLALYLARRVFSEAEDGRYRALRKRWNGNQRNFLMFFLAQAVFVVVFSLPFWIAAHNPVQAWTAWTTLAVVVWLVAVAGESIADRQLAAHRTDPANHGKTCRSGLWRYSRHPNYFFEWLHWFAYVFLAIGLGAGWVAASLVGPAVMLLFLYRVTGIPYTEAQALRTRGQDYAEYQRKTSAFIPLPPKH
jgi:steroid 5-alpha reductase family enzyme